MHAKRNYNLGNVAAILIGTKWLPVAMPLAPDRVLVGVPETWQWPPQLANAVTPWQWGRTRKGEQFYTVPVAGLALRRKSPHVD